MGFVFIHGANRFFGGLRCNQITFIGKNGTIECSTGMIVWADLKAKSTLQAFRNGILMVVVLLAVCRAAFDVCFRVVQILINNAAMAIIKPLYSRVSDYIMEKIQSGEWPVGYMLPTEMDLCKQFGISRPSVRTALLSLVNEGYLVRTKGKGTFVTMPQRLEESTLFIESFAEESRKQGRSIKTEVLEFRIMRADEKIRENLHLKEGATVIKLTRLRYSYNGADDEAEDSGPVVLTTSYFTNKLNFLQEYDFSSTSVHQAMAEHGVMRKYMEKRINVAQLDNRACRLIGVENGSLALLVSSFTKDANDELIEYCESLYPTSRNEFILKIRL